MTARLTRLKTLHDYDFAFQPSLERERILAQLEQCSKKELSEPMAYADWAGC